MSLLNGNKSCCDTPLGTIDFLKNAETILSEKFKLSRVDEVFTHMREYIFKIIFYSLLIWLFVFT